MYMTKQLGQFPQSLGKYEAPEHMRKAWEGVQRVHNIATMSITLKGSKHKLSNKLWNCLSKYTKHLELLKVV